jgi:hypothetical protein
MSLVTLSQKPVLDVTAILWMDDAGEWNLSDIDFEPSLPYKNDDSLFD